MNEIRFGDAVESDTIANLLHPAIGWIVTLHLENDLTVEGEVAFTSREGIALKGETDTQSDMWYWTSVEAITIH